VYNIVTTDILFYPIGNVEEEVRVCFSSCDCTLSKTNDIQIRPCRDVVAEVKWDRCFKYIFWPTEYY